MPAGTSPYGRLALFLSGDCSLTRSVIVNSSLGPVSMAWMLSRWARQMSTFRSAEEYINSLRPASVLPQGFSVGTTKFTFRPAELPTKPAAMKLTLIALDKPTSSFAVMFTKNGANLPRLVTKIRHFVILVALMFSWFSCSLLLSVCSFPGCPSHRRQAPPRVPNRPSSRHQQ